MQTATATATRCLKVLSKRPAHKCSAGHNSNKKKKEEKKNNNNSSNNNNRHYSPPRSSILLYFISGLVFAMTTTNKLEHLGRKKGKYRSHCCCASSSSAWLGIWQSFATLCLGKFCLRQAFSSLPRFPSGLQRV